MESKKESWDGFPEFGTLKPDLKCMKETSGVEGMKQAGRDGTARQGS